MDNNFGVKVWEENVVIPTYEAKAADKNPMFLEKRVYQGSSGKVYPHPVTESISDVKVDKTYKAVFLENQYLKIMILPELGGRIQRALDKTNNYDFVYYNHVIKPALVALAGPWISGGIEFNWPQHHRPSTFDPVEYKIVENDGGSITVWVGEIEKMYHTKGMAGFTLYPDKSYIEINGQLYNPTDRTQTFLWWANPAVPANDYTQSIFPPDVHAVMDHGKRDVSSFPIATGTYYKVDYSEGVDISRYKNIPVPTSYMAYHSDYDFIGSYDYNEKAGLVHIADHNISPGKKQWTWGNGDFGKAWDRNLTDEDGPYVELMTGMYTDNQPDFAFIEPYEEKTFKQYFMPYKDVGAIKNANINASVNLEVIDGIAEVTVYCTSEYKDINITLIGRDDEYINETVDLSPIKTYNRKAQVTREKEADLELIVKDKRGDVIISYRIINNMKNDIPEPAKAALMPEEIQTTEDLFLTAVHLEQYRHATYRPEDYYLEGLRRDPTDIRLNNGYGKLLYKNGMFQESIKYFTKAIEKLKSKNPNPYDGEPLYNLGLALRKMGHGHFYINAYDSFYKSIWNGAVQDSAYYELSCMECMRSNHIAAFEFIEKSLIKNSHNMRARHLKTAILRFINRKDEALAFAEESLKIDCLDFGAMYETYRINKDNSYLPEFRKIMRGDPHNYIELSLSYANAGMFNEAKFVLEKLENCTDPLYYYYLAYYKSHRAISNHNDLQKAMECDSLYCFPNRLEDIEVLDYAIRNNFDDSKAPYYLGNLLYDKGQHIEAVKYWEKSREIDDLFPSVHRNLALAYFNKEANEDKAVASLEKAFSLDMTDARVFLELDQLYKRLNKSVKNRLEIFERYHTLINKRDDLYTEYVTLLNMDGQHEKALEMISKRNFHPWEGGEGKVPTQYKNAHIEIAKQNIKKQEYILAVKHLEDALVYPINLGEGKLIGCKENDIYYLLGYSYEKMGDSEKSSKCFKNAISGDIELGSAMYYNDQPPEMFFYQALAKKKLGETDAANKMFEKLIQYCEDHKNDDIKIDYFAVSLPDFLIFESDLNKNNYVHCLYLKALGLLGKGDKDEALKYLNDAQDKSDSHQGVKTHIDVSKQYLDII